MKNKTLNFNKSTVAQLSNLEQNNINGAAITGFCDKSNPAYPSCPKACQFTEPCSDFICDTNRFCFTNQYMAC